MHRACLLHTMRLTERSHEDDSSEWGLAFVLNCELPIPSKVGQRFPRFLSSAQKKSPEFSLNSGALQKEPIEGELFTLQVMPLSVVFLFRLVHDISRIHVQAERRILQRNVFW